MYVLSVCIWKLKVKDVNQEIIISNWKRLEENLFITKDNKGK